MSTAGALLQSKYDVQPSVQQERFVLRNHIAQSYKGAVFVVEDVWVPCSLCRAPVDPVVRIPVGKSWFHPQCLRCSVCSKPSRTDVFHSVRGQPVCVDCISRGFEHQVPHLHHQSPGKRSSTGFGSRSASRQSSVSRERTPAVSGNTTPRRAISPAADLSRLPRLSATPFLDARSVTRRQQELIERQRLLSEGDQNIVLLLPPSPPVRTAPQDESAKRRTPMCTGSVRRVDGALTSITL